MAVLTSRLQMAGQEFLVKAAMVETVLRALAAGLVVEAERLPLVETARQEPRTGKVAQEAMAPPLLLPARRLSMRAVEVEVRAKMRLLCLRVGREAVAQAA